MGEASVFVAPKIRFEQAECAGELRIIKGVMRQLWIVRVVNRFGMVDDMRHEWREIPQQDHEPPSPNFD